MRVACVLRSGGEYRAEHVQRLAKQVREHLPGAEMVCLSDVDVPCERIPLEHHWPGWWSKMSLFRPDITDDLLYVDLDTSIVGDLSDIASVNRLTIMRDVYRPFGLQSSIMFLPEAERGAVWTEWVKSPQHWMQSLPGGDQAFLERLWLEKAARWQHVLPGQIVSFKVHVRPAQRSDREFGNGAIPDEARVVIFHGKPRPWDVGF